MIVIILNDLLNIYVSRDNNKKTILKDPGDPKDLSYLYCLSKLDFRFIKAFINQKLVIGIFWYLVEHPFFGNHHYMVFTLKLTPENLNSLQPTLRGK